MNLLSAAMSPSAGLENPLGSSASQNSAARALPIRAAKATCPGSHVSSVADRTLEMCVPRERWTPAFFFSERSESSGVCERCAFFACEGGREKQAKRRKGKKEEKQKRARTVEADEDAEVDARPGGAPPAAFGTAPVGVELQEGREGAAVGLGLGARDRGLVGHRFHFFFSSGGWRWRSKKKSMGGGAMEKKKEVDDGGEREKNRGRFWGGRALCSFPFQ